MSKVLLFLSLLLTSTIVLAKDTRIVFHGEVTAFSPVDLSDYDDFRFSGTGSPQFIFNYQIELWSLLGEPVISCTTKWKVVGSGFSANYIYSGDESILMNSKEFNSGLRPWDVTIVAPLGYGLFLPCQPGAMASKPGKSSFNTPESPDWNELFLKIKDVGDAGYTKFEKDKHSDITLPKIGSNWFWISEKEAKQTFKAWFKKVGNYQKSCTSFSQCAAHGFSSNWSSIKRKGDLYYVRLSGNGSASGVRYDDSNVYKTARTKVQSVKPSASPSKSKSKQKESSLDTSIDDMFMAEVGDFDDFSLDDDVNDIYSKDEISEFLSRLDSTIVKKGRIYATQIDKQKIAVELHSLPTEKEKEKAFLPYDYITYSGRKTNSFGAQDCVLDNNTGLVWNQYYFKVLWDTSWSRTGRSIAADDEISYWRDRANRKKTCGYSDWRIAYASEILELWSHNYSYYDSDDDLIVSHVWARDKVSHNGDSGPIAINKMALISPSESYGGPVSIVKPSSRTIAYQFLLVRGESRTGTTRNLREDEIGRLNPQVAY